MAAAQAPEPASADFTARTAALLGRLRRERNGAVAAAMRPWGRACGLCLGVSLPTVRALARAEGRDHPFARCLFRQDVRELRLAALHIARPECLAPDEFEFWAGGIVNAEIAAEAAFALLSRAPALPALYEAWLDASDPLLRYAAMMAAARSDAADAAWLPPAAEAFRRAAADPAFDAARSLLTEGVAALLAGVGNRNEENRKTALRASGSLGKSPAADRVHEELAWRLTPPHI